MFESFENRKTEKAKCPQNKKKKKNSTLPKTMPQAAVKTSKYLVEGEVKVNKPNEPFTDGPIIMDPKILISLNCNQYRPLWLMVAGQIGG